MRIPIDKSMLKSLTLMASVIEARDAYTGGHLWRVSQYCEHLAQAAGLPPEMVFLAGLGGFLHDIGKIGIPDHILGKRGSLTAPEYEVVKTHPGIGAALVQEHPLGGLAVPTIHQHHEWVDGRGYPNRLQGEQISIFGRLVSIADAFDALTCTRPYRRGIPAAEAVAELKAAHGTQFDRELLDTFVHMVETECLQEVVGFCEQGIRMVNCPSCGPVIPVPREAQDGDTVFCRICGRKNRLHRSGETFFVESTGEQGSAEELRPRPETNSIETFISQAPRWVEM